MLDVFKSRVSSANEKHHQRKIKKTDNLCNIQFTFDTKELNTLKTRK